MPLVTYVTLGTPMERDEPLVVSVHEKGEKRGLSLYFGSKELKQLEKMGIRLKDVRKFVVFVRNNKMCLIPLSDVARREHEDIGVLFEITSRLDDVMALGDGELEELSEELLSIIVESGVRLAASEKTAIMRMMKGVRTRDVMKSVLSICARANSKETLAVINRLVISKSKEKGGDEEDGI